MADGPRGRVGTRSSPGDSAPTPSMSTFLHAQADPKHSPAQPSRTPTVRISIAKNPIPSDSSRTPLPNRPPRVTVDSQPRQPIDSSRRSSSRASSFESSTTPTLNGPSHPYGMYPQTSVPRSSSVTTTTSTLRHSSSAATSVTRPAHPYVMYQQNGLPVPDDESTIPQVPAIQVGFPGRNADFHRQLGPDGEEQDIIGPDGHTEQLPPYSKYPNENEKALAALATGVPSSPTPSPTSSHESEQVLAPSARPLSQTSQDHAEHPPSETINSDGTAPASEKSWKEKNWRERWKTKVLSRLLPCWLLVVILVCLILVGIAIGGAIGGFIAKEKQNQYDVHPIHTLTTLTLQNRAAVVSTTKTESTLDASSIPAPTNLPAFPAGQFLLPIGSPDETEQHCLTDSSQTQAWSCDVPSTSLIISTGTLSGGFSIAKIYPQSSPDGQKYQYGAQPPTVIPAEKLAFVIDLSDPQRGAALHFQTVYDKLVILDPSSLSLKRKRHYPIPAPIHGYPDKDYDKSTVQSGEQPWFCFWNSTSIEGFIYVTQPSNNCSSTSTTTTAAAAATTTTTTTSSGVAGSTPSSSQSTVPSSSDSPTPSTTLATSIGPNTVTTTTTTSSEAKDTITTTTTAYPSSTTTGKANKNNANKSAKRRTVTSTNLPQFPYIVKLSERRLPNPAPHAYCQKMKANDDGSVTPVLENNQPIIIKLQETDPTESQFASAMSPASSSTPTSTPTTNKRYFAKRDTVAVAEVEEKDWNMMERSIEERIVEAAVEEWERSFGPWYLGKREEPANSCACQWIIQ